MFKERKNLVWLIAFIIAAVAAVAAITNGVLQLLHRENGYYDVGLTADAQAVAYGSGAHLIYYAEGGSNAIRRGLSAVQKQFSDALVRAWRMTDADQEYENVPNLATINAHPDEAVQVDAGLFDMLSDAAERTARGEGYSVFSGAIHAEWRALRYLEEPASFDPLNAPEEAALLEELSALTARDGMFRLELTAPDTVTFDIAPEYREFLEANELEWPVLDLNVLRDAYVLQMIAATLRGQGLTQGYLYTESGCSVWLEDGDSRYGLIGGADAATVATLNWQSPSAFVQFSAMQTGEERYGFYAVEAGERTFLRHPGVDPTLGGYRDVLLTASLAGTGDSVVDLAFAAAALNTLPDAEAVAAYVDALPEDVFVAWTLQDDPATLHVRAGFSDEVTLDEGAAGALAAG